jgi:hypothetical protein
MVEKKQKLLTKLQTSLQSKLIAPEEIMVLLAKIRCYFCQNPVEEKEYHQTSFWNGVKEDKRLICYVCLRYSYKRNLPLILEEKKELFLEYERTKVFQKSYFFTSC